MKFVVVNRQQHLLTHEHLAAEQASQPGRSVNHPRAMLFKHTALNSLSAALAHAESWSQQQHAVAAAFGHGFGAKLEERLLTAAHRFHSPGSGDDAGGCGDSGDQAGEDEGMCTTPPPAEPPASVVSHTDNPNEVVGGTRVRLSLCRSALSGVSGGADVALTWPGVELSRAQMAAFEQHELVEPSAWLRQPSQLMDPEAVFLVRGLALDYASAAAYVGCVSPPGILSGASDARRVLHGCCHSYLLSVSTFGADIASQPGFDEAIATAAAPRSPVRLPGVASSSLDQMPSVAHFTGPLDFKPLARWVERVLSTNDGLLRLSAPPLLVPQPPALASPLGDGASKKRAAKKGGKGKKHSEKKKGGGKAARRGKRERSGASSTGSNEPDAKPRRGANTKSRGKSRSKSKGRSSAASAGSDTESDTPADGRRSKRRTKNGAGKAKAPSRSERRQRKPGSSRMRAQDFKEMLAEAKRAEAERAQQRRAEMEAAGMEFVPQAASEWEADGEGDDELDAGWVDDEAVDEVIDLEDDDGESVGAGTDAIDGGGGVEDDDILIAEDDDGDW